MSCKSAISTISTSPSTVAVGGTIPLGSIAHRYGCDVALNGNTISCTERGYYDVDISITANPAVAGTITATLFNNGVAVPGATASGAVTTAGNPVSLSITRLIKVPCCSNAATLSVILSSNTAIVNNVSAVVTKI